MLETPTEVKSLQARTTDLMHLGLSVIDLSSTVRSRKEHRLRREKILASTGVLDFTAVRWERRPGAKSSFSIVDKRVIRAGIMLTARSDIPRSEMANVQAFAVNDTIPFNGFKRFINCTLPRDAAPYLLQGLEMSTVPIELEGKPNRTQANDFMKAISTIYI